MDKLLDINYGLLLWTIITFVILLLILWKAAWKPIVNSLDERARKIKDDIEGAEKNRVESEKLLAEHKAAMDKAKSEVKTMIAEGKADAEKVKNDIIGKAREEAAEMADKAKKEIEVAKETAFNELKTDIINISTDIAAKIISKSLDSGDNVKLVDDALNNLGEKKIIQ